MPNSTYVFYRSLDDGEFYAPDQVDDPAAAVSSGRYVEVRVPETIVIHAEDLPGNNDIHELLLRSKQVR